MKLATGPATVSTPTGTGDGAIATVTAVIATIAPGVVDHDGDAYDPGAFDNSGQALISQWQHSGIYGGGVLPVGVGSVREVGDQAIFDGVIFMGMSAGRDVHEWLRHRGTDQEWSYGYDVLRSRQPSPAELRAGARQVIQGLAVYEVSPVRRGAGVGTHTLTVGAPDFGGAAGGAGGDLDPATQAELRAIAERLRARQDGQEAVAAAAVRLIRYQAERRRAAVR